MTFPRTVVFAVPSDFGSASLMLLIQVQFLQNVLSAWISLTCIYSDKSFHRRSDTNNV